MFKLLLKNLLLANYSFARRWVNKKIPQNIIPTTIHTFLTPFSFLLSGFAAYLLSIINYKFKYPEILIIIIVFVGGFGLHKFVKKTIYQWKIPLEYKKLNKNQRTKRNILAFTFFWLSFYFSVFLVIEFLRGYSK